MLNSYTAVVDQASDLLSGISPEEYRKILRPHFSSSVGSHMRHVIDHYLALMNGVLTGHVDYNIRHRHNDVEQNPKTAIEIFAQISLWLSRLKDECLAQTFTVSTEFDVIRNHSSECQSTLKRELVFASSHAIHHYALIRIICTMQNKTVSEVFGFAPATVLHFNKTA